MAKNGFWNSVKQSNGVGDRLYNAEDLSFFYSLFFTNGIACNMDEMSDMFKVTLTNGSYAVKINEGVCIIDGKWHNGTGDAAKTLTMNTSHVVSSGMSRIDAVCIKKDDANRTFSFYIKEGTEAASPTAPEIDKDTELCLAYYTINSSYTVVYDSLVDTRHDENFAGCSHLKVDKPSYEPEVNEYITKTHYIANGVNDNIVLSQLVQSYLTIEKNKDLEINIVGNIGVSGYYAGSGINTDPKVVFALGGYGDTANNTNKVFINFTDSAPIVYTEAATHTNNVVIFAGSNLRIKNVRIIANVKTSAAAYIYRHFNGEITDSYIKIINESGQAYACFGAGKFENNDIVVLSNTDAARAIVPTSKIISTTHGRIPMVAKNNRILAATKAGSAVAFYTFSSDAKALLIAEGNEIYKTDDTTYKTTNSAYQITTGSAIIRNNICEIAGTVYEPTDGSTIINENNIVFDVLDSKKAINYFE